MDDRVHDRGRGDRQRGDRDDLTTVEREQDAGDREEDRGGIEVDRDLLRLRQSVLDGDDERGRDRRHEQQEADVRRRGDLEVPDRRLRHPQQLADEPARRAERDERGDPPVLAGRAHGRQGGEQEGGRSGDGPVRVLPGDLQAAEIERGREHEHGDDGRATDEDAPRIESREPCRARRDRGLGGHGCPRGTSRVVHERTPSTARH